MDPMNLLRVGTPPQVADSPSRGVQQESGEGFDTELDSAVEQSSGAELKSTDSSQVLLSQASKKAKRQAELAGMTPDAMSAFQSLQTPNLATTPVLKNGSAADKNSRVMDTLAERVPQTQFAAVSLRTGDQMLETAPWSKEWVFHSDDAQNPQLKSLLGQPDEKSPKKSGVELKPGVQKVLTSDGSQINLAELEKLLEMQGQQGRSEASGGRISAPGSNKAAGTSAAEQNLSMNPAEAELTQMLERLNGELETDLPAQKPVHGKAVAEGKSSRATENQGLGGSDFMDMKQAVMAGTLQGGMTKQQGSGRFSSSPEGQAGLTAGGAIDRLPNGKPSANKFSSASIDPQVGPVQSFVARPHDGISSALVASGAAVPVLTGQTTQGAAQKDRLASEALKQISEQIGTVSQKGAGFQNGEMRIRLKPDDLGEVHLRVNTNGNQVGLQIQASTDRAKKVIEESLVHLRDSLAHQNLVLAKADVGVGLMNQSSMNSFQDRGPNSSMTGDFSGNNPNANAYALAQDGAGGRNFAEGRRSSSSDESEGGSSSSARGRGRASDALSSASMAARNQAGLGRIDITA